MIKANQNACIETNALVSGTQKFSNRAKLFKGGIGVDASISDARISPTQPTATNNTSVNRLKFIGESCLLRNVMINDGVVDVVTEQNLQQFALSRLNRLGLVRSDH